MPGHDRLRCPIPAQAYSFPNQIGLVVFGSEVKKNCPITQLYENFRGEVDRICCEGDTKLWEAIAASTDMLKEFAATEARKSPPNKPLLRILVLSDGADTKSSPSKNQTSVFNNLRSAGITLDAIVLGSDAYEQKELLGVTRASGGFIFAPDTMAEALQVMESETVVSMTARADQPRRSKHPREYRDEAFDVVGDWRIQQAKHPEFMRQQAQTLESLFSTKPAAATTPTGSNVVTNKRLTKELKQLHELKKGGDYSHIEIFPSCKSIMFWKAVMKAPSTDGVSPEDDKQWYVRSQHKWLWRVICDDLLDVKDLCFGHVEFDEGASGVEGEPRIVGS